MVEGQGHTYSDISAITGWSYSKVNRCLSEGRRSFLASYESIESGAECERWLPVISALVDGEATPQQIIGLRPHLRNCSGCRATLKALQESSGPLSAVLPVPLIVMSAGSGEHLWNLFLRTYEALTGGLHERAVHSVTKAQVVIETSVSGKVAAVAASAAAVAGGGYTTLETAVKHAPEGQPARTKLERTAAREAAPVADPAPVAPPVVVPPPALPPPPPPAPDPEPAADQPKPDPPSQASEFDVESSSAASTDTESEFNASSKPSSAPTVRKPRRPAGPSQSASEFSTESSTGEGGP